MIILWLRSFGLNAAGFSFSYIRGLGNRGSNVSVHEVHLNLKNQF